MLVAFVFYDPEQRKLWCGVLSFVRLVVVVVVVVDDVVDKLLLLLSINGMQERKDERQQR